MIFLLDAISDIFSFITNGNFGGIPTLAIMAIPLIIGIIVGFLVKKILKWAIIAGVIVVVLSYLGFFGLSLSALQDLAVQYSPIVYQYGILLMGILPLSIGFVIGIILGFIFG
jgi:uncharacterized membrane protein (Fun14 family)